MKFKSNKIQFLGSALLLGSIALGFSGPTNMTVALRNTAAKPTKAATDAEVVGDFGPVPKSEFSIPRKVTEGKDPFFPNSTRVYGADVTAKPEATQIAPDLALKGISGTPEQPLAIINTTTCTTGELAEIITKSGRMRVQCVEINMAKGTVLLQIGAERRELRLSPNK